MGVVEIEGVVFGGWGEGERGKGVGEDEFEFYAES